MTSYVQAGSAAVIGLVLTPVLVIGLGKEAYGIWVVVGSLALYRQVLQLGLAAATPKYIAEYAALDDDVQLRSSITTSFWLLAGPGALALLAGLAFVPFFPDLFDISPDLREPAQILLVLIVIDFALAIPGDAFGSTLIGLQRFDLLNWTLIVVSVLTAAGWAIAILAGGGLVAMGVVSLSLSLGGQLARYLIARRLVPGLSLSPRLIDRKLVKPLAALSVWLAIDDAAFIIINRIDAIVVGLVVGLEAAAIYGIGQKLVLAISGLVSPISVLFYPHSAELAARRDYDGLRDSLLTGTRIVLGISFPIAIALSVLAGPILEAWVGPGFAGAVPVIVFLSGAALITSLSLTGRGMLQGTGRARRPGLISALELVLNLALSVLLAHALGLEGVALGTLIAATVANLLILFPYVCRSFGIPISALAGAILRAEAPPTAVALLIGWLMIRADPSGIPAVIACAAAIAGSYLGTFAFTGLSGEERRALAARLRALRVRPEPPPA
jgi:O-antigen/teichoic acid export membrane protein